MQALEWFEVLAALRFAIVSVRTSTRGIAYGQMEQPDDPDDLIMFREPARADARSMRGRSYAFAVCAMLMLGSTVFAAPGVHAITKAACNQPIVVARLAFGPGTIPRGGASTARLSGRNCTRHPRAVSILWTGKFSGNGAVNCPVIDPLSQKLTVPAASALTASLRFVVQPRARPACSPRRRASPTTRAVT